MSKKLFLSVVFCLAALSQAFGGGGAQKSPKSLELNNISSEQIVLTKERFELGIFPAGTTVEQVMKRARIVAGVSSDDDISEPTGGPANFTATVPLFDASKGFGPFRWTGSGTYDVFLILAGTELYVKRNVEIKEELTKVDLKTFTKQ